MFLAFKRSRHVFSSRGWTQHFEGAAGQEGVKLPFKITPLSVHGPIDVPRPCSLPPHPPQNYYLALRGARWLSPGCCHSSLLISLIDK